MYFYVVFCTVIFLRFKLLLIGMLAGWFNAGHDRFIGWWWWLWWWWRQRKKKTTMEFSIFCMICENNENLIFLPILLFQLFFYDFYLVFFIHPPQLSTVWSLRRCAISITASNCCCCYPNVKLCWNYCCEEQQMQQLVGANIYIF